MFQDYFRFICLNREYVENENEIGNIWDFLRQRNTFDFSNITWQQLRRQSYEWHEQLIAGRYGYSEKKLKEILSTVWPKTIEKDFVYNDENGEWTITELTSGVLLHEVSNVPSAIFLSRFTDNYPELVAAVNIGSLGVLISSLASLITLKEFLKHEQGKLLKYIGTYTLINTGFLIVLLTVCLVRTSF